MKSRGKKYQKYILLILRRQRLKNMRKFIIYVITSRKFNRQNLKDLLIMDLMMRKDTIGFKKMTILPIDINLSKS